MAQSTRATVRIPRHIRDHVVRMAEKHEHTPSHQMAIYIREGVTRDRAKEEAEAGAERKAG